MSPLRIGIDEVGRGPIAGPVGVGVFAISESYYHLLKRKKFFAGLKDSKALSEKKRQEWVEKVHQLNSDEISWTVFLGSSKKIDKEGIAIVIKEGIIHGLKVVGAKKDDTVLLDGGIKAPASFLRQKTIIKGDEKEEVIALAGGTNICQDASVTGTFPKLPTGGSPAWDYGSNSDSTAGDAVYQYSATGDGKTITCTATGCVTS